MSRLTPPVISPTSPRRVPGPRARALTVALSPLTLVAVFALWEGISRLLRLETYLLPSPGDIMAAFQDPDTQNLLATNVGPTVEEAMLGFVVCVVVGVALAWAMDAAPVVRNGLYPLLIASQAVPVIAIAAVLVVAFGYGLTPKVIVVVLYAFFAVTVNVYDALQGLDPDLPGLLRTLGASRWDVLRTARLPAALPGFFTGAKLAAAYSVAAAVYSEWVGSTGGLGYALIQVTNQFKEAQAFAVLFVMVGLSLALFAAIAVLERLCIPWARRLGAS